MSPNVKIKQHDKNMFIGEVLSWFIDE